MVAEVESYLSTLSSCKYGSQQTVVQMTRFSNHIQLVLLARVRPI